MHKHFEEEESSLFSLLDFPLCNQAQDEHAPIRAQIQQQASGKLEMPASIAQWVEDHIRWEEQILFLHLVHTITESQLTRIGQQPAQLQQHPPTDNCSDTCWV